jgi:hypothetical protein
MWNPNYRRGGRRRRGRANKGGGIEINKAVGGTKQVYNNSRMQFQTIEFYDNIVLPDPDYNYLFRGTNSQDYNLTSILNDNNEFLELRKRALQYKVTSVAMSFSYNRVPAGNDKFSKMIITPETDMVLEVDDPKINSNSMVWDMSVNGTKNYSFRINNRNTEKINVEWQIGESQWNAICVLHLSSQGDNYIHPIPNQTPNFVLGEVKFSVRVKYIQTDMPHESAKRITQTDLLNIIMFKFSDEIMVIKMKKQQKRLEQEKEKIDQELKQINAQITENVISDQRGPPSFDDVE